MPVFVRWLLSLIPTNPIVVRLVQGGSRRARHMYIRAGYLALLIIVLLALLLQMQSGVQTFRQLAASAARAFELVAYLQIGLICILSPVFMAGAIAQESNPRTWDILLTTPLSAAQIVLGQLFGRLFFILALLLASLPLFALTQYFGGVPGRAVFLSYAVSAGAAMLVGAVAVALSVNRLAGRRAVFSFYVSVITYLAVTIGIDRALRAGNGGMVTWMTPLNPFLALNSLLSPSTYARPPAIELAAMGSLERAWFGSPVMMWCVLSVGLSILLAGVSTFTARTIVAEGGTPWYRRIFGFTGKGVRSRAPRNVWNNPIAWREAAARQATLPKTVARWAFIASGVLWALGLILYFHQGAMSPHGFRFALLVTVWTELIVITLIAVNVSATAISREREDGTLDILLTTPITQADYLNGKLRGLISYLLPLLAVPMGTLAMVAIYVLAGAFGRTGGATYSSSTLATGPITVPLMLPEAAIVAPLAVLPFIAFAVMVGLQWSLKSKGTIASVVGTVGVVGVIGGVIGMCGFLMGNSFPFVGPAVAALNPLTTVRALIFPEEALSASLSGGTLTSARIGLAIGSLAAVGVYAAVVSGMRSSMVRTFDTATRRLAGAA